MKISDMNTKTIIALAQTAECPDVEENLKKSVRWIGEAAEKGASLIVFPEVYMQVFPRGTSSRTIISSAQTLDGPFVTGLRRAAAENGIWVVFGMREVIPGDSEHTRNTTVVLNSAGEICATYGKTHLFDGLGYSESKHVTRGDKLFDPIDTPFGKLGLIVCYEIRFPEVARIQMMKGADIIVMPAAWASGKGKVRQLHTLVSARAMENTVYLLCCDLCGEASVGASCAANPAGELIVTGGSEEELLYAELDPALLEQAKERLPVLEHRRTDLYILEETKQ